MKIKTFIGRLLMAAFLVGLMAYSAQAQEKQFGFNHGQVHHFAQLQFQDNGYLPDAFVDSLKKLTPPELLKVARMSGTMSNSWSLDIPGYNHFAHNAQIDKNKNLNQPTESYIYSFVKLYHQLGIEELFWTLNTHQGYMAMRAGNRAEQALWERRMYEALYFLLANGVNITHICMDNEWWMDFRICGVSSGSLNAGDKTRYAGALAIFRPNPFFVPFMEADMQAFMDYLKPIADSVRKIIPGVKILMTVDNTSHIRGRTMWSVVSRPQNQWYDGITPHIYFQAKNRKEVEQHIRQRLQPYGDVPIYITEYNYDFGTNDQGKKWPEYVFKGFRQDCMDVFKAIPQVKAAMFHTWWAGLSSYGYIVSDGK